MSLASTQTPCCVGTTHRASRRSPTHHVRTQLGEPDILAAVLHARDMQRQLVPEHANRCV